MQDPSGLKIRVAHMVHGGFLPWLWLCICGLNYNMHCEITWVRIHGVRRKSWELLCKYPGVGVHVPNNQNFGARGEGKQHENSDSIVGVRFMHISAFTDTGCYTLAARSGVWVR